MTHIGDFQETTNFGFACWSRDKLGCKSALPVLCLRIVQLKRKRWVI